MRTQFTHAVAALALLGLCPGAGAQRDAVKRTAGDASATKADPPAHASAKHSTAGKKKREGELEAKNAPGDNPAKPGPEHGSEAKEGSVYAFGLPTDDGKNLPLNQYKGKVLLIVNLGRESTYAAQLPALTKLNDTFKDKGLVVIGVPSNDFGAAEPGTEPEIAKYYKDAKVDFPVMEVSSLTGVHELPLFTYLTKSKAIPNDGLHWNYTKFLVDRKGNVIVRFPPEVAPDSLEMTATVQEVLDGTWKPKKAHEGKEEAGGGDDDDDE